MFNLGLPELLVISMAALLVFGPKRLPELAKSLGQGIRDFKKALNGDLEEEAKSPTQVLPKEPTASAPKIPSVPSESQT